MINYGTIIQISGIQKLNTIKFTIKEVYGTLNNGGAFNIYGLKCWYETGEINDDDNLIKKNDEKSFEFIVLMPNWRLCGWRNCLTNKRSWVLIEVSKNLNEWVVIAAVFVASNSRGSKEYSP